MYTWQKAVIITNVAGARPQAVHRSLPAARLWPGKKPLSTDGEREADKKHGASEQNSVM